MPSRVARHPCWTTEQVRNSRLLTTEMPREMHASVHECSPPVPSVRALLDSSFGRVHVAETRSSHRLRRPWLPRNRTRQCVLFHELHKVASATVINMWKHGLQPKATSDQMPASSSGCVRVQASIEGYAYWCDALLWDWKTEMCTKTADAGFASSIHRDVVPPPHQIAALVCSSMGWVCTRLPLVTVLPLGRSSACPWPSCGSLSAG